MTNVKIQESDFTDLGFITSVYGVFEGIRGLKAGEVLATSDDHAEELVANAPKILEVTTEDHTITIETLCEMNKIYEHQMGEDNLPITDDKNNPIPDERYIKSGLGVQEHVPVAQIHALRNARSDNVGRDY